MRLVRAVAPRLRDPHQQFSSRVRRGWVVRITDEISYFNLVIAEWEKKGERMALGTNQSRR